ncbi:ribonuclease H-like domain-containing protein [Tanacetum coccineum]
MVCCNPCLTHVDTESKLGADDDLVSDLTLYRSLTDVDWAGCPTRRLTSRYCVFLSNNLLSWSSKSQVTLSRSSTEAGYRGVAHAAAETYWLRNLLRKLHTYLSSATFVNCDNVSAIYLSSNPVQHQRTKHIEIDIHLVRDLVDVGRFESFMSLLAISMRMFLPKVFLMRNLRSLASAWVSGLLPLKLQKSETLLSLLLF